MLTPFRSTLFHLIQHFCCSLASHLDIAMQGLTTTTTTKHFVCKIALLLYHFLLLLMVGTITRNALPQHHAFESILRCDVVPKRHNHRRAWADGWMEHCVYKWRWWTMSMKRRVTINYPIIGKQVTKTVLWTCNYVTKISFAIAIGAWGRQCHASNRAAKNFFTTFLSKWTSTPNFSLDSGAATSRRTERGKWAM